MTTNMNTINEWMWIWWVDNNEWRVGENEYTVNTIYDYDIDNDNQRVCRSSYD